MRSRHVNDTTLLKLFNGDSPLLIRLTAVRLGSSTVRRVSLGSRRYAAAAGVARHVIDSVVVRLGSTDGEQGSAGCAQRRMEVVAVARVDRTAAGCDERRLVGSVAGGRWLARGGTTARGGCRRRDWTEKAAAGARWRLLPADGGRGRPGRICRRREVAGWRREGCWMEVRARWGRELAAAWPSRDGSRRRPGRTRLEEGGWQAATRREGEGCCQWWWW